MRRDGNARFLLLSPAVNGRWPGQDVLGRVGHAGVVAAGNVEESIKGGIPAAAIVLGQECCRGGQLRCPRVVRRVPSVCSSGVSGHGESFRCVRGPGGLGGHASPPARRVLSPESSARRSENTDIHLVIPRRVVRRDSASGHDAPRVAVHRRRSIRRVARRSPCWSTRRKRLVPGWSGADAADEWRCRRGDQPDGAVNTWMLGRNRVG